jgi:hypothetical protein
MEPRGELIIKKAENLFPDFHNEFWASYDNSSQVIVFGSFACQCENENSDIDILFIGDKKRRINKNLDFIWLRPEKIKSRTWLGSELASHIGKYGVWLKGDDSWRHSVFFSRLAATKKKEKIFYRCIHILLKREILSYKSKKELFIKILINCERLKLLNNHIAIPPTYISVQNILRESRNMLSIMFLPEFLGPVFKVMLEEVFPLVSIDRLHDDLRLDLTAKYGIEQ